MSPVESGPESNPMKANTREELIEAVSELRFVFSGMRFAQLVLNIAKAAGASELGESNDWEPTRISRIGSSIGS